MSRLSPEYYAQYIEAANSHWWFRGRERVLRAVAQPLICIPDGSVVVDVGSGPGGPARRIFPAGHLIAVDLSSQVLQAYSAADGRLVADAARLSCRPNSVRAICAFDVLEHLEDDAGALQGWQRVLCPGGWLIVTVPAYRALWSRHDEVNHHQRRYQAQGVARLLSEAGFHVVRVTYFNTLLLPAVALVRWTQRLLKSAASIPRGNSEDAQLDCQQRVPAWLERCCEGALGLEARWLRHRRLPAGVSICAVAQALAGSGTGRSC